MLLQLQKVTKSYGDNLIFRNINFEVDYNQKVAIVGRNGIGKTTLLKIIARDLTIDDGTISLVKNTKIGLFNQDSSIANDLTINEVLLAPFKEVIEVERRKNDVALKLEKHPHDQSLLNEYQKLDHQFINMGSYDYEYQIKVIVSKFKFNDLDLNRKVESLSGGQKTRLALASLLLQKPDLLILDEPTNHLDVVTIEWLEGYLKAYQGGVVFVSHDRFFIDKVASKIFDIENKTGKAYTGNYSQYIDQKAIEFSHLMKQYEKQQREIAHLEDFVARNIVRASTTKRAQSRRKKLEKMDRIELHLPSTKTMGLEFEIDQTSGIDVLKVDELAIGYDRPLAKNLTFKVNRKDRIGIVGPNGIGKSTLLKTIAKELPALAGKIQYGHHVSITYFDQEQQQLTSNYNLMEEIRKEYPNLTNNEVRSLLGNFLFSQDDAFKSVGQLSGGEKVRLMLAKLVLKKGNLLLLDEPTNHLDINAKEMLEVALDNYEGTIIFISHDRYFIDQVATRIMEIEQDYIKIYDDTYSDYIDSKASEVEVKVNVNHDFIKQKEIKRELNKLKKRYELVEKQLVDLDDQIKQLKASLFDEDVYNDYEKLNATNDLIEQKQNEVEELEMEWMELQELIEG